MKCSPPCGDRLHFAMASKDVSADAAKRKRRHKLFNQKKMGQLPIFLMMPATEPSNISQRKYRLRTLFIQP